ncbi:type II toxin-antitoxin system PemK/MazF family toxin [Actinotalea solisilvae]|uniref:type II toxin-antitoxin system PemK/MazF family toxin n=1 Tax=Actinotalea solisilvae TaxID=2072922 RepID=UPI0018F12BA2|nr:type II toxin-antitoxin system PemK/MazF family toxin [Actinotalea solisilvae]
MPSPLLRRVLRLARAVVPATRPAPRADRPDAGGRARPGGTRTYPGDFTGTLRPVYAPDPDGAPDPGEIVWAWVPYEEDHTRGKDRPVLLVGRDGPWLLGLMLTSRDHDARPGRPGEDWLDLGTGDWDARRRPSEVRLDRVVRVDAAAVRREGAMLDRGRFDQVVAGIRSVAG